MKVQSLFAIILFCFAFSISGCTKNDVQSPIRENTERTNKIRAELDRLNSWDKSAIDRYENPLDDLTYMGNGETAALISVCKSRLKELGVSVRWDRKKMLYVIAEKKKKEPAQKGEAESEAEQGKGINPKKK